MVPARGIILQDDAIAAYPSGNLFSQEQGQKKDKNIGDDCRKIGSRRDYCSPRIQGKQARQEESEDNQFWTKRPVLEKVKTFTSPLETGVLRQ